MDPKEFAPYGEVLAGSNDREPDYDDAASTGWSFPLFLKGTPELIVVRTPYVGLRFSKLERHFNISQAFVPLQGVPSAVVVAPPTDLADRSAIPSPDSLRAFVVNGSVGYLLRRGTWHSLDRYPLSPGFLDVVMLTAAETTKELEKDDHTSLEHTQEVDYQAARGLAFEIIL
jgi:ureidoglycolate lyase